MSGGKRADLVALRRADVSEEPDPPQRELEIWFARDGETST